MVKYFEIIKSVKNKILEFDENAKVYGNEIVEGYERPCYFIEVLPITRELEMSNRYNVSLLVVISYFSDTESSLTNYEVLENLFLILQGILIVGDRKLTISNFNTEKIGEHNREFNISFSLKFKDSVPAEYNSIIASEVHTKIKRG